MEEQHAMRILVVEDNPKMAGAISRGLTECGYAVDVAHTRRDGEEKVASSVHDLLVVDRMLPDGDGADLCRGLRERGLSVPVLLLTALSHTVDKVSGLDAGADDYLTKPFEFEELVARVRALLRRGRASESATLAFEDVRLDLVRRLVTRAGRTIKLTPKEFSLLEFMMRNPNRVLGRTTIGEKVWDMRYEPSSNVIDVYVSSLRRKLGEGFERPLIHTVVGTGYRFGLPDEELATVA